MLEATGRCLIVPGRPGGGAMGQGEGPCDRGRGHVTGVGAVGQGGGAICLAV